MQKELVKSLRELEVHPSSQNRKKVAHDLCDICLAPDENLSSAESTMFFDILCTLIGDVELDLRARLAERLAERDDVPHDLITFLASEEIAVAYPVLVSSELLNDRDLVLLINEKAREHQLAVTKRYWLSPDVSEALVQTGDSTVVVSLLSNDGAEIYPETAERLVGACRDSIDRHSPDDIQICGRRTTDPPPWELRTLRSPPMRRLWRADQVRNAIWQSIPPSRRTSPIVFTSPLISSAYAGTGLGRRSSIKPKIFWNKLLGTATSANWNVTYRP